MNIMNKNWTYEEQMKFESDVKDSILATVAYYKTTPSYNDISKEEFNEFCDSLFEEF